MLFVPHLQPWPAALKTFRSIVLLILVGYARPAAGQGSLNLSVDLAPLEGVELTPVNAFSFRLLNAGASRQDVRLTGTVHFRNSPLQLRYACDLTLEPGVNAISAERVGRPVWTASDEALRSLFLTYGRLPQGTYEYCVSVQPKGRGNEQALPEPAEGCTYHTVEDLFAINLIEPEDKAQLHERYPTFSWVVNYPLASELTYRIRVAEQRAGQNPANAIARNNPVWQEAGLPATVATYPLAGRPLEVGQPYVWTVDAYYHGLLLGGAETWRFVLVDDSVLEAIPQALYHIDIRHERRATGFYAVGVIKLKYVLQESRQSTLTFSLRSENGTVLKLPAPDAAIREGDNRIELDLTGVPGIRHSGRYLLSVQDAANGQAYELPIRYVNPDFL